MQKARKGHSSLDEHVLGSTEGTGDGAQLHVAPATVKAEDLGGSRLHVLRKSAIEVGAHPFRVRRLETCNTNVIHASIAPSGPRWQLRMRHRRPFNFESKSGTPPPDATTSPQTSVPWMKGKGVGALQPPSPPST